MQVNFEPKYHLSHKKSTNAVLQKIDSFEIEGPAKQEEDFAEAQERSPKNDAEATVTNPIPNLRDSMKSDTKNKSPKPDEVLKIPTFQTMELEDLYDIRKTTNLGVSTFEDVKEEDENKGDTTVKSGETADESTPNKAEIKPRMLRKGFSYSDFEVGLENNKRKITFDRRYDRTIMGYGICTRVRDKLKKWLNFSRIKTRLENSFVEVVITCTFYF